MSTLRLARFLARAGVSSRRGAAELVAADRVRINGAPPKGPGDPVDPARDKVTLDGRSLRLVSLSWLALNKPPGYVTSRRAAERHPSVFDLVKDSQGLVAVGRLDVMSEGLLLFTTDGDLASRLMHPKWQVPRRYRVAVTGRLDERGAKALEKGVRLDGEDRPVRLADWRFLPRGKAGILELELAEGRSRVVRRLCAALNLGVRSLTRTAYGPVELGEMTRGTVRKLRPGERVALYKAAQLDPPPSTLD
ncbi:MAG: pseudouridine synthase [Gemmatimonadales bacterium]